LATPFTAATVVVPPRVAPPGLVASATVTLPIKLGTGFPAASSALTWTAGLIAAPATVLDGCTVKASWVVVPGMMSNAVLVTGAKPLALAVSVYPVPVLLRLKSKHVATPLTAAPGSVPNTSWVAAPGVILKPLLVAGFRPIAVAVSA